MSNKDYKFPTAVHSYFHASNRLSERAKFLESDSYQPVFNHMKSLDEIALQERLCKVEGNVGATLSMQLVCAGYRLRDRGDNLKEFREANVALYGEPKDSYAELILSHYKRRVTNKTQHIWLDLERFLGRTIDSVGVSLAPNDMIFNRYRRYLLKYITLPSVDQSCFDIINQLVCSLRLDEQGWRVRLLQGDESARTYHGAKSISIGKKYRPRTKRAALRIGVHEVLGHALRGKQRSVSEAEGFAVLLEQLTDKKFIMRRSYRYLAIALGWGSLGLPMTFRQVFEVMWRVMMIGSAYEYETARSAAFDECYRAFRGGRPDIAGSVFLKDLVYFDANIKMWKILEDNVLDYDEFVDTIEGRRLVL